MNTSDTANPHDINLVKSAYALADALAPTREMKEIYLQDKDMTFEEWVKSFRQLLFQIDQIILQECGIPVFQAGLHNNPDLSNHTQAFAAAPLQLPAQIQSAALNFGCAFCQTVKHLNPADEASLADSEMERDLAQMSSTEIIDLCQQMVTLVFDELGLKSTDIAKIY